MALGNLTVRLGLDAADYLSGLSKAEAEAAKFAKQQERTSLAIDKQIKALQDQAATLGYSERQLKIVELAQRGATKAQLESANAALKQKEAFQEANKAIANAAAKAKATTDATAAIDKQVKALQDQVAVQGKSAGAAKLYALSQQGANKAQIDAANAALKQQAAYEAGIKIGNTLRTAIIALGAAFATTATVASALFVKIVGDLDDLDESAQALGTSAVALSEYRRAASESGLAAEKFDTALTKLSVKLADAAGGGKDSQEAFKALGIEIRNSSGQLKTTDELLGNVADRFSTYRDSAEKTALAVELFGRAGARMIPFLNQGSEGLRKLTGVTEEGVKAARELQAQFDALKGGLQDIATGIAISVMPFLTKMVQEFIAAKNAAEGFGGALKLLAKQSSETLADPGAKIEDLRKKLEDLRSTKPISIGDLIKFGSTEGRDKFNAGAIEAIEKELKFLKELQRNRALVNFRADYSNEGRGALGTAPVIPRGRGGGSKTDEAAKLAKKQLDEQISQLENFIKREDRLLEERNHTLDRLYDQDRISIQDYFSGRSKALDDATFESADIYREQIDNLKKFVSETKDETLKLAALKEIGTKTERQADFLSDSSRKATKLRDDAEKALATYGARVDEVRNKVLELAGAEANAGQIAARRFDASNAALLSQANRQGDEETKRNLTLLRQREVSLADINKLLQDAQVIEQRLGTTQAKLNLERDLGLRSQVELFDSIGKSSTEAAAKLQVIADKYLLIAQSDGSEVLIANAEAFQQKIKELAATTDILAAKIRQTFVETGASAIETFLNSVADGKNVLDSFKTAFTQFANDIIRQINRIAAQNIADALFKSGSGGGGGGIFSSIADAFVSYIASLGRQEKGGPVSGSTPYVVGERGPEIFVPRTVASAATKQIDSLIAQTGKPAEYTDRVKAATVATNLPHLIGAKGPEIFVPKIDGIIIPNDKVNKLSRVLQGRASGGPVVSATPYIVGERGPEIFTPRNAATLGPHEKVVTRLVSIVQPEASQVASNMPRVARGSELFVSKAAGIIIPNDKVAKLASAFERNVPAVARRREISAPLARTILRDEKIITRYANAPYSRPVAAHVPYIIQAASGNKALHRNVGDQAMLFASPGQWDVPNILGSRLPLVTNIIQHKAQGSPFQAPQTYVVGERGPELFVTKSAEKIIKNESRVSELVTNNARRNEKVINDLVSKTVHHRERSVAPAVAAKIIKNESRISELVSNDVQRNKEIINRLVTTTRREGGRSNELLIVGAHGPELFIPKAAGSIIRNERRINELVSNIEHRDIGRRSEKTIDEIISSTVQRRAKEVAAYQTHLGSETNITNNNGISVPADFFSNLSYRRAIGGMVAANRPYIVGEKGPEMFVPKSAGTIVSNTRGGMTQHITFNLATPITRDTQNQIATRVGQAAQRAQVRGIA